MKIIEVIVNAGHEDTLRSIAEQHEVVDFWHGAIDEEERVVFSMIVRPEKRQVVLDALQSAIGSTERARINVLPLEVTLPRPVEKEDEEESRSVTGTREELYNEIEKGAKLDGNYLLLVFLSTVVATIGLVENNVAVIIGAMVIAPLLGPNIALAFSTSLGDTRLMWSALKTSVAGLGLAVILSSIAGMLLPIEPLGSEILARTDVGISGVLLALASGAAAVLSLTTGVSSALVGVMVAVALLPPTATLGMMLGIGQYDYALGAALLLAVNVVCVNLSAKLVFLYRGVKPRTWLEKQKARQSTPVYILVWGLLLVILLGAMYVRHTKL
ncbi:MAG: TIGR00341 family protein [Sedimenticolaceae bacterium]|nr:TIGR00341 family protein [Sedimenticolaceae bacterium]